jgi:hypothetical protein
MSNDERKRQLTKPSIVIGGCGLVGLALGAGYALANFRDWGDVLYGAVLGTIFGIVGAESMLR